MKDHHTLRLTREIAVPVERVWESLVRSNDLDRWLTSDMQNDPRVGGEYRDANGDKGTYLVVEPPGHLRFSWQNERHCPDTFVDLRVAAIGDGRSRLHLEHEGLVSEQDVEHMRQGWDEALDNLRLYLESQR